MVNVRRCVVLGVLGALAVVCTFPAWAQIWNPPPSGIAASVFMCSNCTGVQVPTDDGEYVVHLVNGLASWVDVGTFGPGETVWIGGQWNYDLRYSVTPPPPPPPDPRASDPTLTEAEIGNALAYAGIVFIWALGFIGGRMR